MLHTSCTAFTTMITTYNLFAGLEAAPVFGDPHRLRVQIHAHHGHLLLLEALGTLKGAPALHGRAFEGDDVAAVGVVGRGVAASLLDAVAAGADLVGVAAVAVVLAA